MSQLSYLTKQTSSTNPASDNMYKSSPRWSLAARFDNFLSLQNGKQKLCKILPMTQFELHWNF